MSKKIESLTRKGFLLLLLFACFSKELYAGGGIISLVANGAQDVYLTDRSASTVYSFNPNNLSTPAALKFMAPNGAYNITISPDGTTSYFTDGSGDVYSFSTQGPFIPTLIASGMGDAFSIAVTSDGSTLIVASVLPPNIYTVPATGGSVTTLISTGAVIVRPFFLVITGNTAFVGDQNLAQIFSFPITPSQTTYNATLLQNTPGTGLGGLAISNDGFLYWSTGSEGFLGNWVYRVPLASPTDAPTLVGTGPSVTTNDLSVSCDSSTVFIAIETSGSNAGVWSIPTNQGLPQAATHLTNLNLPGVFSIGLGGCATSPDDFRGAQKKCDCGLVYDRCNILKWDRSPTPGVLFYRIYRNGVAIATVGANTFSYIDHDRKKGVTTLYSVTSINASGESALTNVTIE